MHSKKASRWDTTSDGGSSNPCQRSSLRSQVGGLPELISLLSTSHSSSRMHVLASELQLQLSLPFPSLIYTEKETEGEGEGEKRRDTYLISIQTPELEFLFKERSAHVGGVVKFACSVVVEDLSEDTRMSVEEELVQQRIIVGKSFGQLGEACGGDLAKSGLVSLEPNATHVQGDSIAVRRFRRFAGVHLP